MRSEDEESGPSSRLLKSEETHQNSYREQSIFFRDGKTRIDYVLAYDSKDTKSDEVRSIFEAELVNHGLLLEYESGNGEEDISFTKVHATWDVLCKWAEITRMPKAIAVNDLLKDSPDCTWPCTSLWDKMMTVQHPRKYNYNYSDHENDEPYFTAPFDTARINKFIIADKESFFTTAERQRTVLNILSRTRFGNSNLQIGIDRLVDQKKYAGYFPPHEGDWRPAHLLKNGKSRGAELNNRQTLYWIWARPGMWCSAQPLELIRQYFGEKIGFYFAWLGYYTAMLIPVSILGLMTFIYGLVLISNDEVTNEICTSNLTMCPTCDKDCPFTKLKKSCAYSLISRVFDNDVTLVFALIMSLWATLFLEFWKRKRASLVYTWDLENFEEDENQVRPEYEGLCKDKKLNPVTGQYEPYIPFYRRIPRLIGSCSVFFVFVVLVVGAVFGVVVYRMIVAAILPRDSSKIVTTLTGSVINFIVITLMNLVYEKLAEYFTYLEAPRTATEFEDSFTLKMFLFQAVNYYSSILYIAFLKGRFVGSPYRYNRLFGFRSEECDPSGCLAELCIQLAVIMILKQALNNIMEILVPLAKNWWRTRKLGSEVTDLTDVDEETALYRDYVLEDPGKWYLFSEYLEMVVQFGFVTLFVASFPLAPLFALLNNVIEIRLDAYKITTQVRRIPALRAESIGRWFGILKALSTLAVITNGLVIAITSDLVPRFLYRYLYSDCAREHISVDGNCLAGYVNATLISIPVGDIDRGNVPPYDASSPEIPDKCWYRGSDARLPTQPLISYWHVLAARLALLVVFEHAVFSLKLLIDLIIPDVPEDLKQQMSRQKYLELMLLYEGDESTTTTKPAGTAARNKENGDS